ncbi:hypothetical protein [Lysobacter gummosus]|uniref:hypothetical protein n=1 Tax=Lysobacter gummosus TaxID=262324 RepID=UPI003634F53A
MLIGRRWRPFIVALLSESDTAPPPTVIPAKAGIQRLQRDTSSSSFPRRRAPLSRE